MEIIKRDKTKVEYDQKKIVEAIKSANADIRRKDRIKVSEIKEIADEITNDLQELSKSVSVEDIQDKVEKKLIERGHAPIAKQYIRYRYRKELLRQSNTTDNSIRELLEGESDYWSKENSNKNAKLVTTQRDYIAGIVSKDISKRFIIPKEVLDAHDKGIIHIHDTDYLAQNTLHNCCLVNLEDMLQNGTVINNVMIERPHRFLTAATIASQIITAVSSSQYGGTSISLSHLAPFVNDSRKKFRKKYENINLTEEQINELTEIDVKKEIEDGIQTFIYQVNSMSTTNGQSPFLTTFMYLNEVEDEQTRNDLALIIEEMLKQRIEGVKNRLGVPITYAFPKLILCLDEHIMNKESKYHYLLRLAAECTSKRLVPDYVSEKVMKELKINQHGIGDVYPPMGCRSFLTPDRVESNLANAKNYKEGKGKYYGRANIGVSTLNLPYIAWLAKEKAEDKELDIIEEFYKQLEKYAELCHDMQRIRAERLSRTRAEVAPILWVDGALARLRPEDTLDKLVHNGYMTSSLGYSGLYETVKILSGENHWDKGHDLAIEIMQTLNGYTNKWKQEENIDYSIYGTPMESGTFKFAKACKERFGDDIFQELDNHDRYYITNSVHIPVFHEIDPFTKLSIESEYQNLSPGGNIIYVEVSDLTKNLEALEQVIEHIYNTCMYAEINTETSYCHICGANNSIHLHGSGLDIKYICEHCGNEDESKMNFAVRVCGYLSTNSFNQGRAGDIKDRYKHLDTHTG